MASGDVKLKDDKVTVIGCGHMGSTWMMLYARAGYRVSVYDISTENMTAALDWVRKELHHLEDSGHGKTGFSAEQQYERIAACSSVEECVQGSILIQECIPEDTEIKQELLGTIDRYVHEDAIILTLSGGELPSLLSKHLNHKKNFAVVHPLMPPLFIKSVEVVPAPWTNASTIERLTKILEGLGFLPIVHLKEIYGYVANRIQNCLMAECYQLVKGGYCDVTDVETGIEEGLGLWYPFMGLFELEHLNADGYVDLCNRFGNMCYEVQKSFLPPERMEGPTLKTIHDRLCEIVPMEMIDKQRRFRTKALTALQDMKNALDVTAPWRP